MDVCVDTHGHALTLERQHVKKCKHHVEAVDASPDLSENTASLIVRGRLGSDGAMIVFMPRRAAEGCTASC